MLLQENSTEILSFHKLKAGESLHFLSKTYNIPIPTIEKANSGVEFLAGTTVAIPKTTSKIYTAKIGDTVQSICEQFGISQDEFCKNNKTTFVYPGRILEIRKVCQKIDNQI